MFLCSLFSRVGTCQQLTYKNGMKFLSFTFSTVDIFDIFDTWGLLKSKNRKKFLCPIFLAVHTNQLLKNKNRMKFLCSLFSTVDTCQLLKNKNRMKFLRFLFSIACACQLFKNKNGMKFFCSILTTPVKCCNRRKELKSCILVFYTLDTCQLVITITGRLFVLNISLVKLTPVNGYQTSQ